MNFFDRPIVRAIFKIFGLILAFLFGAVAGTPFIPGVGTIAGGIFFALIVWNKFYNRSLK